MSSDQRNELFSGIPLAVEPAAIERELARLWKPADEEATAAVTRACLANLIVLAPDASSRAWAAAALAALGRRLPARSILLTSAEGSGKKPLSAWITAICHRPRLGAPPVCCEQITLGFSGLAAHLVRGAVTPLLVPDLPAYLVVPDVSEADVSTRSLLSVLGDVLDGVLFDTRKAKLEALEQVFEICDQAPERRTEDLAWRALASWRLALRDVFDAKEARKLLIDLDALEVDCVEGLGEGLLLASWVASRLGIRQVASARHEGNELRAELRYGGRLLRLTLRGGFPAFDSGSGIHGLRLGTGALETDPFLRLELPSCCDLLEVRYCTREACVLPRSFSFARVETDELLGTAVERPTRPDVFVEALRLAVHIVQATALTARETRGGDA